ncbi:Trypanosomal VSG domain [Trypanosoma brucei equiperdum]|uniref:Trypanosomal VSG domain n=1 Tax=Trypanosoma brucei equiperdum TaxID=630700 RepID=A0A3L6KRC4_9TRYP|nr:Trypanosomal VSG domain [Trypanosoma brucei equiperdum]
MQLNSQLLKVLLQLMISTTLGSEDGAAAFSVFCNAYNLAQADAKLEDYLPTEADTPVPQELTNLWLITLPSPVYDNDTVWEFEKDRDRWRQIRKELEQETDTERGKLYTKKPDTPQKTAVHRELDRLRNRSVTLAEAIKQTKSGIETAVATANEKLKEAAIGRATNGTINNADFGQRQHICGGNTGRKPGRHLAADIVCVCAGSGGSNACGTGIGSTEFNSGTAGGDQALTAWQSLMQRCTRRAASSKASDENIAAVLQQATALIGTGTGTRKTPLKVGGTTQTDCNGGGEDRICVDYTQSQTAGTITQIPWLNKLAAAAEDLTKARQKQPTLAAQVLQMKQLADLAWTAYNLLNLPLDGNTGATPQATAPAQTEASCGGKEKKECNSPCKWVSTSEKDGECVADETKATPQTNAAGTGEQAKPQCETINKATECKEQQPKCEWKNKDANEGPHCKLNETHVAQKATQAGTGGSGKTKTTYKCSQAKNPEECAAVKSDIPKDKKAVCGWIKGKSKDSSFLVNKKFSLMAADIVNLVEL